MTPKLLVAFRVDASLAMGSGHVMRCLSLAEALRTAGAECLFVCRVQAGDLRDAIEARGFPVVALPANGDAAVHADESAHAGWLGCDWSTDARLTTQSLGPRRPDWLVVDHYALDQKWESALRRLCAHVMVIDDLADRMHDCDLLLDQNLGRHAADYEALVPAKCRVLVGAGFAMLRAEFAAMRPYSLDRRDGAGLKRVLIAMGGVDQHNATGLVLHVLSGCTLPADCRVTVVLGKHAPWITDVRRTAGGMSRPAEVLVDVDGMAALMADCDVAIGAAGTTSWERCCLGLPALLVTLAQNQRRGAQALEDAHAAICLGDMADIHETLPRAISAVGNNEALATMSDAARRITDGRGLDKVLAALEVAHA